MLGLRSRKLVRSTACSRNSLAKAVWAAMEELPSKGDSPSSSLMVGAAVALVLGCSVALALTAGDAPLLNGCNGVDAEVEMEPLLWVDLMPEARLLSSCSMFASRSSIWSILRSLGMNSMSNGLCGRKKTHKPCNWRYALLGGDQDSLSRLFGLLADTSRAA